MRGLTFEPFQYRPQGIEWGAARLTSAFCEPIVCEEHATLTQKQTWQPSICRVTYTWGDHIPNRRIPVAIVNQTFVSLYPFKKLRRETRSRPRRTSRFP